MSRPDFVSSYRQHAATCIELAREACESEKKLKLLDMAQTWLTLAEQAMKNRETALVYETPDRKESA
jgi:hypothetical protein